MVTYDLSRDAVIAREGPEDDAVVVGTSSLVLAAPAEDRGTMAMLASIGLRGLARLDGDVLRVRVSLRDVRPVEPVAPAGEVPA